MGGAPAGEARRAVGPEIGVVEEDEVHRAASEPQSPPAFNAAGGRTRPRESPPGAPPPLSPATAGPSRYNPAVPPGKPRSWQLISVLFSSVPLTPDLATSLYQVAVELHRGGQRRGEVMLERAQGRVRNLGRSFALGAISGPGFEADLETERGEGRVRFLVTRQGLARAERAAQARGRSELPN